MVIAAINWDRLIDRATDPALLAAIATLIVVIRQSKVVKRVEKNTNSLTTSLTASTRQAASAEGQEIGRLTARDEAVTDAKTLNERSAATAAAVVKSNHIRATSDKTSEEKVKAGEKAKLDKGGE